MPAPDWLPALNLFLLVAVIISLVPLMFWFYKIRPVLSARLLGMVEEMKHELPPALIGEIMTRWDMNRWADRLDDLEAQVDHLSRQSEQNGDEPFPGK